MARIIINEFKGIMPKISNDKLPENMAQIAQDVKTASGAIEPFKRATTEVALAGKSYKTLFEYVDYPSKDWVYYDGVVFWSRSPVADDVWARTYFMGESGQSAVGTITFTTGMTDGETLTIDSEVFEFDIAEDGVGGGNTTVGDSTVVTAEDAAAALCALTPTADVTLTDNGDGTVTVTADDHGTAGNSITFSETGAHITMDGGGVLGGTQSGMDDGLFKAFANDISSPSWDFTVDYYLPGADAGQAPTLSGYTGGGTDYRAYFYTFVSRYGEEGPGSDIAEITDYTSGRVQVDDITYPDAADDHLITPVGGYYPKVNVYRTVSTGAGTAEFLLVCSAYLDDLNDTISYVAGDFLFYKTGGTSWDLYECTAPGTWSTGTFSQGELVTDPTGTTDSYLWRRCPDDLTNMRSHPNGFFVASKDNTLYFSEPFAPWAWPEDYEIPIDSQIIGLGVYGTTIVVATDGPIYTFTGPHPDSMYKQKGPYEPCLSQRAVVETDLGVIFPSRAGFQLVAADAAPKNVTQDFFKPEDWDNYEIETMHGVWYNKAYHGFFKSEDYQGNILLDFLNGKITTGADYHYAAYVTLIDGYLKTIFESNIESPTVLNICRWDSDPNAYRPYLYKSPRYILTKPANFKVAQVILDTEFYNDVLESIAGGSELETLNATAWATTDWGYQLGGPMNDFMANDQDTNGDDLYTLSDLGIIDTVEFRLYADGVLKFTKYITSSTMFKLPRGYRDKKWEVEVTGMIPIKRIIIATSTEEIA